jgi:Flp pilus assembly pilin Flp
MLKKIFSRVKSQKGMSGVLVALLLVVVGVGLVAGVKTFMDTSVDTLIKDANNSLETARGN